MNTDKIQSVFFFTILIISIGLMVYVLKPFIGALALAAALAIVFQPVYKKILKFVKNRGGASFLTIIIIMFVVILPLSYLASKVFTEATDIYNSYLNQTIEGSVSVSLLPLGIQQKLSSFIPWLNIDLDTIKRQSIDWLVNNFGSIFSGVIKISFNFLVMIISIYYFLKDGKYFKDKIKELSPLKKDQDEEVIAKMELTVNSVIKGSVFIAIVQGILTGIGFAIFDISEPILWGAIATISSLIPTIGTSIIFIPAVIYLFLTGNYLSLSVLFFGAHCW